MGIVGELFDFFAAAIGNEHQLVGLVQEAAKDNGTIGRCAVGSDGGKLEVTGKGLGTVAVEGSGERRSPRC